MNVELRFAKKVVTVGVVYVAHFHSTEDRYGPGVYAVGKGEWIVGGKGEQCVVQSAAVGRHREGAGEKG